MIELRRFWSYFGVRKKYRISAHHLKSLKEKKPTPDVSPSEALKAEKH